MSMLYSSAPFPSAYEAAASSSAISGWAQAHSIVAGSTSIAVDRHGESLVRSIQDAVLNRHAELNASTGTALGASTFIWAVRTAGMLPSWAPPPDVSVHDDGEIGFYWSSGRRRVLAASVNGEGRLSFAMVAGTQRGHWSAYLGERLPTAFVQAMREMFPQ